MTSRPLAILLGLALAAGGSDRGRPGPAGSARRSPFVLCYVESMYGGAVPEALDLSVCTHVIEAFLLPEASGAVRAANGLPRREIIAAAHRAGARALVAVGGATTEGATFGAITASPEALRRFSGEVARFVLSGGYDGVDLDWEFPSRAERRQLVDLVRAVRERLEAAFRRGRATAKPLVFLGVTTGAYLESYDFPALAREVDVFVQFGYDFRNPALGPWAHTAKLWPDGASAPIEASVRGVASAILHRGAPREKLVIALPLYASDGRPWAAVRQVALASPAPVDPLFLESEIDGIWITGPAALAAKARKAISGSEIAGGAAAGVALWQLGHQGPFRDLTEALRRALPRGAATVAPGGR